MFRSRREIALEVRDGYFFTSEQFEKLICAEQDAKLARENLFCARDTIIIPIAPINLFDLDDGQILDQVDQGWG